MRKITLIVPLFLVGLFLIPFFASAHRSGCHRWHSCPSDSGSYTCGDAGHPCQYPTYPASGGVIYPPSGYYKDCYDCPLKKVPNNAYTSGIDFLCNSGYEKVGSACQKVNTSTNYYKIGVVPEGALIKEINGIDIYIVKYAGIKKFKRLVLSPSVFNNYGHLKWNDVIPVSQVTLDSFTTSELVRAAGDDRVYRLYPQGDTGQKRLIKDKTVLTNLGLDPDSIYEINIFDSNSYISSTILE